MSVLVDYGVFPVSQVSVHITRFRGKGIRNGMAFGTDEAGRITIRVGSEAFRSGVRLGLATDPRDASSGLCSGRGQTPLMEEELATHVEPIARSRAWTLGAGKNVGGTRAGHASGPAGKGDHGLDHTHIWGRTYRGG